MPQAERRNITITAKTVMICDIFHWTCLLYTSTLALVRDLFIFACFTALSFVDMKELATDEIVEVNGEKWILSKRHKTNVPFQVKLLDIPLQIIERYKYLSEDRLVFGKINYWTMCKQLKKVMAECGIEKQISYHCARHTFGTLALSKGCLLYTSFPIKKANFVFQFLTTGNPCSVNTN